MPKKAKKTTKSKGSNTTNNNWVQIYLHQIGLPPHIYANFEAAGIVTPAALAQLEAAHFAALGVIEADDRRKLFFLVQRVRQETENRRCWNNSSAAGEEEQQDGAVVQQQQQRRSRRLEQKRKQDPNDDDDNNGDLKHLEFPVDPLTSSSNVYIDEVSVEEEDQIDDDADADEAVQQQHQQLAIEVEGNSSIDEDDVILADALATPKNEEAENDETLVPRKTKQLDSKDSMDELIEEALQTTTKTKEKAHNNNILVQQPTTKTAERTATKTNNGSIPEPRSRSSSRTSSKLPQARRRSQLQAPQRKRPPATTAAATTNVAIDTTTRTGKPLSAVPAEAELPMSPLQNVPLEPKLPRATATAKTIPQQHRRRSHSASSNTSSSSRKKTWKDETARLRAKHDEQHAGHEKRDPDENLKIRVVVRKRPPATESGVDILHPLECCAKMIVYQPKKRVDLSQHIEVAKFAFDQVFGETRCNREVYEDAVRPLLPSLFDGQWVTVLCYGQTGSGKTHTMVGVDNDRDQFGLYAMAAFDIFHIISDTDLLVHVSMFEIYNGKLWDLLQPERSVVQCWEDSRGQVCFPGLSHHHVTDAFDMLAHVQEGFGRRATGSTSRNADSSRSHAVLQVHLYQASTNKNNTDGDDTEISRLTLMDLAGSERAGDETYDAAARQEGAEINTSLLALKEVIRALAMGDDQQHIPYRGSKLTQVLRPAFSDARTVLIACVAPDVSNCEPTLNTLRYADRVHQRDAEEDRSVSVVADASNTADDDDDVDPLVLQSKGSGLSFETNNSSLATDASNVLDDLLATPKGDGQQQQKEETFVSMYNELLDMQLQMVNEEINLSSTLGGEDQFDRYLVGLEALQREQLSTIQVARELLQQNQQPEQEERDFDDSFIEDLRD